MKNRLLYLIILLGVIMVSCSPSARMTREERKSLKQEQVSGAIVSQRFVVNVDKVHARRSGPIYLRDDMNYIVINGDHARMNLAYVGRSYDFRGITGINMAGPITKKSISNRRNGNTRMTFKIEHKQQVFTVQINVSKSGDCRIDIFHPKIDASTYRGYITAMK